MYPTGHSLTELGLGDWISTSRHWDLRNPAPDSFAARAKEQALVNSSDQPVVCRYGMTLRETWGSSFGAYGLYLDYVFLDREHRVVTAYRRFLD